MVCAVTMSLMGCASVSTSAGPSYQRTRADVEMVRGGAAIIKDVQVPLALRLFPASGLILLGSIEMPFAAVFDTLDLVFRPSRTPTEKPNKAPEPTSGSVTPRATESTLK